MKISKVNDQKKEWDAVWERKSLLHRIVDIGRHVYNWRLSSLLKPHSTCDSFCELGCGSSTLLLKIAKRAKKVYGIDYSEQALYISRKLFKKNNVKNGVFIKDNCLKLKTKKQMDVVWSQGLIEHFSDPSRIIKAHMDLTKKSGHTIISVPFKPSYISLWYRLTRPKAFRKLWPWTEQIFFTKKSLIAEFKKRYPDQHDYNVKVLWVLGAVLIFVHKH